MACKKRKKRGRLLSLVLALLMVGVILPVNAEEVQPEEQVVKVKNSYLNVTSINKKKDAKQQDIIIDKCFLSIIRINLGDKEVPIEVKE